jgi:hypothetical protein
VYRSWRGETHIFWVEVVDLEIVGLGGCVIIITGIRACDRRRGAKSWFSGGGASEMRVKLTDNLFLLRNDAAASF